MNRRRCFAGGGNGGSPWRSEGPAAGMGPRSRLPGRPRRLAGLRRRASGRAARRAGRAGPPDAVWGRRDASASDGKHRSPEAPPRDLAWTIPHRGRPCPSRLPMGHGSRARRTCEGRTGPGSRRAARRHRPRSARTLRQPTTARRDRGRPGTGPHLPVADGAASALCISVQARMTDLWADPHRRMGPSIPPSRMEWAWGRVSNLAAIPRQTSSQSTAASLPLRRPLARERARRPSASSPGSVAS